VPLLEALGHRQITTIEVYAKVSDEALKAAVGGLTMQTKIGR
jgi:hypothetical protein